MGAVAEGRTRVIGRGARWLLLVGIAFGLAMMHTLGHAGMHPDGHRHAGPMSSAGMAPAAAGTVMTSACLDCPEHDGTSPWAVCLAVLGSLTLVLFILVLRARRPRTGACDRTVVFAGTPRSPPGTAIGLTVASTALLRI